MKFSRTLALNENPEWAAHYIAYPALKKLCYRIERADEARSLQQCARHDEEHADLEATAASGLLGPEPSEGSQRQPPTPDQMSTNSAGENLQASKRQQPSFLITPSASDDGGSDRNSGIHSLLSPSAAAGDVLSASTWVDQVLARHSSDQESVSSTTFLKALDIELEKVSTFYLRKERELLDELSDIYQESAVKEMISSPSVAEGFSSSQHDHLPTEPISWTNSIFLGKRLRRSTFRKRLLDFVGVAEKNNVAINDDSERHCDPDRSDSKVDADGGGMTVDDAQPGKNYDNGEDDDDSEKGDERPLLGSTRHGDGKGQQKQQQQQHQQAKTGAQNGAVPSGTEGEEFPRLLRSDSKSSRDSRQASHAAQAGFYERLTRQQFERRRELEELRIQLVNLYVSFDSLRKFVALNRLGFGKILKKHDKVVGGSLSTTYARVLAVAFPFRANSASMLVQSVERIVALYSRLLCEDDIERAKFELKTNVRELIQFERTTIWRDIIAREQKKTGAELVTSSSDKRDIAAGFTNSTNRAIFFAVISIVVLFILANSSFMETPEQQGCLAILAFASMLWASETIPLFVTSAIIPFLIVLLRVVRSDDDSHTRLAAKKAAEEVFASMFTSTIMLLLGGFTLAAALSKHQIAKEMATWILSRVGTKPSNVLLANMFVATFMSMWISNVAAPVLCFSLIQPILRTLPEQSAFAPALIMGIALASNIGGLASPISSPQNIIALEAMSPSPVSWFQWLLVSVPTAILADLACWLVILFAYKPHKTLSHVHPLHRNTEPFSRKQIFIMSVVACTIGLWCAESWLEHYIGSMGIIAIFPILFFFGTGILSKSDLNGFLWNVVVLSQGGLALGFAVKSSGLLKAITVVITPFVSSLHVYLVFIVFGCFILVMATFISHTVSALIILPLVAQIGSSLPDPKSRLLVMGGCLICSTAMGLPVSGFPNMNAVSLEDHRGKAYVTTLDFLRVGIACSVLSTLIVFTVSYGLMLLGAY